MMKVNINGTKGYFITVAEKQELEKILREGGNINAMQTQ